MFELIKKSLFASLGAAVVTRDRIREATRSLVEEGKISAEEAERLGEELVESGKQEVEEAQSQISDMVRKGLDRMDISSKKEFQHLQERVEQLEKRLAMLERTDRKDAGV